MAHRRNYSHDYITNGITQFDTAHQLGKKITLTDLSHLPAAYGGHVSVIPYYYTENNATFLLTLNHWKNKKTGETGSVLGCIGGGVKNDITPYTGLLHELDQEVPTYKDTLLEYIESEKTEILALENKSRSRDRLRYYIFIFVPIPKDYAMHIKNTFRPVVNHNKPNEQKELGAILFFNAFPATPTDITFAMIMKRDDLSYGLQGCHSYGQHNRTRILHSLANTIESVHKPTQEKIYTIMNTTYYFPESIVMALLHICITTADITKLVQRISNRSHLSLEELVQKQSNPVTSASKRGSKPASNATSNAASANAAHSSTSSTSSTSTHSPTRNASNHNHNNGSWTAVTRKQRKPKKPTKKKGTRKI